MRFGTFGDSRIQFDVVLQAQEFVAQGLLRHELVKRLHQRFRAAGVRMREDLGVAAAPGCLT